MMLLDILLLIAVGVVLLAMIFGVLYRKSGSDRDND